MFNLLKNKINHFPTRRDHFEVKDDEEYEEKK